MGQKVRELNLVNTNELNNLCDQNKIILYYNEKRYKAFRNGNVKNKDKYIVLIKSC